MAGIRPSPRAVRAAGVLLGVASIVLILDLVDRNVGGKTKALTDTVSAARVAVAESAGPVHLESEKADPALPAMARVEPEVAGVREPLEGEIAGTVVFGDRVTPAAGVEVWAACGSGPGHTASSDASGRFRFQGLPAGSYEVRLLDTYVQDFFEARRTVVTGTGNVTLTVDRYRVDLVLWPDSDRTARQVALYFDFIERARRRQSAEPRDRKEFRPFAIDSYRVSEWPHERTLWVDAPGYAWIEARAGEGLLAETIVSVEEGRWVSRTELVLGAPEHLGRLRLVMIDSATGARIKKARVTLEPIDGGWPVLKDSSVKAGGVFAGVPPGSYRLRADVGAFGWIDQSRSFYLDLEYGPVEICANRETRLELAVREGGRLRLAAFVPGDDLPTRSIGGQLMLRGSGRQYFSNRFFVLEQNGGSWFGSLHTGRDAHWPDALAPGTYVLESDLSGYSTEPVPVTVQAGEVTAVRLELSPD